MYEFFYHVRFQKENEKLNIKLFLSLEDFFTPVYLRTFDADILNNKLNFLTVYQEISEYFDKKKVVMNEDDLRLFYETLTSFDMEYPQVIDVLNQYDEELDTYNYVLTPKDIIFLNYVNGKAIDDKRYKSWEEDNHLDTLYLRQDMIDKKLVATDNYYFNLTKAKRELLLEVVEAQDLDVRGDNDDLVEKIKADLPDDVIKKYFSGTHYTLTKKGKKVIDKSKKLIDFNRSFFRYVNKLPLEEFHLLSIKKSDYDFNGLGRLLMVNENMDGVKFFDWSMLKSEDEEIKATEEVEEKAEFDIAKEIEENNEVIADKETDEFKIIIDRISASYDKDKRYEIDDENTSNEIKEEENKVEIEEEDVDLNEVDGDEDLNIKDKIDAYYKKRKLYEQGENGNKEKTNKKKEYTEDYSDYEFKNKRHPVLKKLFYLVVLLVVAFALFYLNEEFTIIKVPFTLQELFNSLRKTIIMYKDKIMNFIDYMKDYKG